MNAQTTPAAGMSADVAALLDAKDRTGVAAVIQPKFNLAAAASAKKPALNPHEHISKEDDSGLKQIAAMMVDDRSLSVTSFLTIAQPFDVSQVKGLDGVLATMRANKAGEFGKLVLDTNSQIRRMKKNMPEVDPRFVQRIKDGLAKPMEIINFVVELAEALERALKGFDTMLAAVQENERLMEGHYKSAYELVLTCMDLSVEQDERTHKLLKLLALVDHLRAAVSKRLEALETEIAEKGELKELLDERDALGAVSPLILRRSENVTPMVLQGNINEERFLTQAQLNALNALDLRDFIDVYLVQIKTDIVTGLLAVQSQANMFAIRTGIDLAQKASAEANEQYAEQVSQSLELITTMLSNMDVLFQILDSTIDAGDKLHEAFMTAAKNGERAAGDVEEGMGTLKNAEKRHLREIRKIMERHEMEVPEEVANA